VKEYSQKKTENVSFQEETLVKGLGADYEVYQKKTKKLIPGIW